jgi:carbamoyl-phosphate synthase large subunit
MAAGAPLPNSGRVFISVSDADKPFVPAVAKLFADLGFELVSTGRTAQIMETVGFKVRRIFKLQEGRPNALDLLKNREIQLVINTPAGQKPREDEVKIRTTAVYTGTPIMTTISTKAAALPLQISAIPKSSGFLKFSFTV